MPMTDPIPIGYFPKIVLARPDWLRVPAVQHICSVSECMSPGPADWIFQWTHNNLGAFNSEDEAWNVVPDGRQNSSYRLLAYFMVPLLFRNGKRNALNVPVLPVQPVPESYERIGYDCVVREHYSFGCSPLSCNRAAEEYEVNRFCLLDDLADALELAARFSDKTANYEPGDYVVIEVWAAGLPS